MKDGSLRFCAESSRLNAIKTRDAYPTPRKDDCLDFIGGATILSTLDCNIGYLKVPITPENRDKTAFICQEG